MRKVTGKSKCQRCGNEFQYYRSPKNLIEKGEPKYCNEECRRKVALERIYFSWDNLCEKEKIDRLQKSFEEKVIRKEGCWDWKGAKGPNGYLNIRYNQKKIMAHRASWILYKGEIPEGIHVLHKCDNRRCTNPEHLFLGTEKDNAIDRQEKNRGQKGITHNKCKLSEDNVREIKILLKLGVSCEKISKKFCVTNGTIWFIKSGITWKHIE